MMSSRLLAIFCCSLLLSGCGGGGSSADPEKPVKPVNPVDPADPDRIKTDERLTRFKLPEVGTGFDGAVFAGVWVFETAVVFDHKRYQGVDEHGEPILLSSETGSANLVELATLRNNGTSFDGVNGPLEVLDIYSCSHPVFRDRLYPVYQGLAKGLSEEWQTVSNEATVDHYVAMNLIGDGRLAGSVLIETEYANGDESMYSLGIQGVKLSDDESLARQDLTVLLSGEDISDQALCAAMSTPTSSTYDYEPTLTTTAGKGMTLTTILDQPEASPFATELTIDVNHFRYIHAGTVGKVVADFNTTTLQNTGAELELIEEAMAVGSENRAFTRAISVISGGDVVRTTETLPIHNASLSTYLNAVTQDSARASAIVEGLDRRLSIEIQVQ